MSDIFDTTKVVVPWGSPKINCSNCGKAGDIVKILSRTKEDVLLCGPCYDLYYEANKLDDSKWTNATGDGRKPIQP